jgi:putative transposase
VVNELKAIFSIQHLLKATGLAKSVYYHCKALRQASPDKALQSQIAQLYHEHKGRYGYRRITMSLRLSGVSINHKRVQRLMGELGLKSKVRPNWYTSYKGDVGKIAPDLVQREFTADKPNQKWVTDVTEFKVGEQKVYLSPVIDLFNQEVVSYEVSKSVRLSLVTDMLKKATAKLGLHETPIVHPDQGWQYQNRQYQQQLKKKGLKQSMSRKGTA